MRLRLLRMAASPRRKWFQSLTRNLPRFQKPLGHGVNVKFSVVLPPEIFTADGAGDWVA